MAAVASEVQTVSITINGVSLQVPKGELIVESVKRLGLEIPIFCYHSRMKPVGMCRMCLVEVGFPGPDGSIRKMPKPQAGCTLPASEGMAIYTDTEQIHKDRKGVLEFLLVNHPLDCPICDRGGECPLQNNTLFYGPSTSRYLEIKRHLPKAFPLSNYVTLDLERCIQCGRCVRFTEEISGDSQLAFRFRGAEMQPSTFELRDFDSKFSGNVIEICPVGALTNREYRFRARPWDLETRPAVCSQCSNGCNVWFDYRVDRMVRINGRTNEAVNEEWTCDKGKFGHEWYNSDKRLKSVFVRNGDALIESDWATAFEATRMAFSVGGNKVAAIAGARNSNEDLYQLKGLFNAQFASANIDHRFTKALPRAAQSLKSVLGVEPVQSSIAGLESKQAILIFGTSLADEAPIIYLRARKAWFQNGTRIIVANDSATDADSFAHLILRYRPGTESVLANGLLAHAFATGRVKVPEATAKALTEYGIDRVANETGVPIESIKEVVSLIDANAAILTCQTLLNTTHPQDTLEALAGLAMTAGAEFNCFALGMNDQGADEIGFIPGTNGKNTREILEGCVSGEIEALWVVGVDLFEQFPDKDLVARALENVGFLVVQDCVETETMKFASVVLPQTAPAEQEGSYCNAERRVQAMQPILAPKGGAKPAWRAFAELSMRIDRQMPVFQADEVFAKMAAEIPAFSGISYANLQGEGVILAR